MRGAARTVIPHSPTRPTTKANTAGRPSAVPSAFRWLLLEYLPIHRRFTQ